VRLWPAAIGTALVLVLTGLGPGDEAGPTAARFEAVDIFVDSGPRALAAWQVEVGSVSGSVKIVGIEGGEAAPFRAAPFYDPEAMQAERVIIAGLSTAADLPKGRTRVARIHVRVDGPEPEWRVRVEAAAGADGEKFEARAYAGAAGQGEGK
jgi:hypothetical protein